MPILTDSHPIRVGVVGTGFIARRLVASLRLMDDLQISVALTRRALDSIQDMPSDVRLTQSTQELLDRSDIIVELSLIHI